MKSSILKPKGEEVKKEALLSNVVHQMAGTI